MADQHNSNIPAMGNQISADIPDIKENLEFHKDALQVIFETWSDSDNSSAKFNTATGFTDGTYNYEFPTNGVGAHSVIMLGTSSTIIWMYLNAAPPGWKVLATGADSVIGVSGGAASFNVNGGNPDSAATWTVSGLTKDAHTHSVTYHTHMWYDGATGEADIAVLQNDSPNQSARTFDSDGSSFVAFGSTTNKYVKNSGAGDTGAQSDSGVTSSGAWRPKASIGKLYQLDTA